MKKIIFAILAILILLTAAACGTDSHNDTPADITETDSSKHINVSIPKENGTDVYQVHENAPSGYRYGPSVIVNDDGSIDMWLAGAGSGTEQWDWIVYMHSKDGVEWSEEKCVLQPTPGSLDHYSCCDPGVIYFGGYYYLGYTATLNNSQCDNNLYVARSENPDGPFEKWNGSGWGGDPKPIVFFTEDQSYWGIGEVSFVELDGTLYIYYTVSGAKGHTTRVAIADATDENWPLTMEYKGIALGAGTNDAIDVKYVEEYGRFVAVASDERLTENSYLVFYESEDGFKFTVTDILKEYIYYFAHNPGISGTLNGHITPDMKKYVAYAYGKGWGVWNTRIQEIEMTLGDSVDKSELEGINYRKPIQRDETDMGLLRPVGISTGDKCVMRFPSSQKRIIPTLVYCNVTHTGWKTLNNYKDQVRIYGYDESVIRVADASVIAFDVVGVGETTVTFEYNGFITYLRVIIYERETARDIVSVEPMAYDTLKVNPTEGIVHQIRSIVRYGDGHWDYAWSQTEHGVSYEYDPEALGIDENSHLTVKKSGKHEVTIIAGECRATLTLEVSEDDLTKLTFKDSASADVFSQTNNAEICVEGEALKLVTTKAEDPFVTLSYRGKLYSAEDYDRFVIRYMIPEDNTLKAYNAQIFFSCDGKSFAESVSVREKLKKDGKYHELSIDLSDKDFWSGEISEIRIDFFDTCALGDEFYIESIELK